MATDAPNEHGESGEHRGPHEHRAHGRGRPGRGFGAGFPMPPFGGPRRRRGGRARRGDVRAAVLLLLQQEPMHGYQLIHEIGARTNGTWTPSPGAVYPTLRLLEDEGLVTSTQDEGRRLITLTEAGRTYLAEHAEELGDPFTAATDDEAPGTDLRHLIGQLFVAAGQVAQAGDEGQRAAAAKVLTEARRALYLILATDPAGEQL